MSGCTPTMYGPGGFPPTSTNGWEAPTRDMVPVF